MCPRTLVAFLEFRLCGCQKYLQVLWNPDRLFTICASLLVCKIWQKHFDYASVQLSVRLKHIYHWHFQGRVDLGKDSHNYSSRDSEKLWL